MILTEWETVKGVPLSTDAVATLRQRHAQVLSVLPSWETPGTYDVSARGFVGAVGLPDGYLVLQPKVPVNTAVYMLARARALPPLDEHLPPTALSSLTAAIAHWFLELASPLVERSLLRRYRLREEESTFIRGKVDIVASLRLQAAGRTGLACRYDDYTPDVVENQILLAAAHILLAAPTAAGPAQARLRRLAAMLAEVEHRVPERWERTSVVFDRLSRGYRPALALAEWILQRASPEIQRSDSPHPFHAFLIDMADVFESYVAAELEARLGQGYRCRAQAGDWLDVDQRLLRTVPDIQVRGPEGRIVILDTKYKRLDGAWSVSEADVYQMITYCVTRGAETGILVYPRLTQDAPAEARIIRVGVTLALFPVDLGGDRAGLHRSLDALATYVRGKCTQSGSAPIV